MNNSIALSAPIELINITPFNPLISKCQIKVCWVGPEANPNKSIITKETAYELANSLPGSPIVGYYNETTEDFEQHNKIIEIKNGKFKLKPTTQPYGFVDLGAKVWFQKFSDNGVEREYLVTEGWLWTGQFPECQRIIQKGNNQSMELDETYIDAHWTKDANGNKQFFIINEAIISKLCILGDDFRPCFEGANITAPKIEFSFEDDFKEQLFSMISEIKTILNEGGTSTMDENIMTPAVEEGTPAAAEEFKADEEKCPKCGKPLDECECDKDNEEFAKKDDEEEEDKPSAKDDDAEDEDTKDEDEDDEEKKKKKEFAVEKCPKCGKPLDECTCEDEDDDEEDKPAKYNLEEIPEYIELRNQYNELKEAHDTLKAENEDLVSFKLSVERKDKEAMIDRFYMLTEEDKKDVVDNIDTYSLDDIEAKLSVICVRNKVSFADLDEDKGNEPTVYSLNSGDYSDNNDVPEWVKAIRNNVAKNN